MTPMMKQYLAIKDKYKEYILMYRVGDFYEMFFEDAKVVSDAIDLVLTGKDCGEEERAPMCGIPYHAVENYLGRLVSKGFKVAICEQMEDPSTAVGIVKREVIKMVTPGTMIENNYLDEKSNNYLGSIYMSDDKIGLSFADISTGVVYATECSGEEKETKLTTELGIFIPKEIIINKSKDDVSKYLIDFFENKLDCYMNYYSDESFDYGFGYETCVKNFKNLPNDFNEDGNVTVTSLGGLFRYIKETQKNDLENLNTFNYYYSGDFMSIDINTRRNLEITETMRRGEKKGSLLWVLDKTTTAAGGRLLKNYLDFPLLNPVIIGKRQDAVKELLDKVIARGELSSVLSSLSDIERTITRISYGTGNCKDLKSLEASLVKVPEIKEKLKDFKCEELRNIYNELDNLEDVTTLINESITDDPPFSVREGGMIKDGYNSEIDNLRKLLSGSNTWLKDIEEKEKEKSGIKNLRVGYNKVFGYYIEVSKTNVDSVPDYFIRKQTLVNGERFITEELKNMEVQMLGASEKDKTLEYQIFVEIRKKVSDQIHRIQKTAYNLAKLDVYISFAEVAQRNGYIRPEVDYSDTLEIKDGRHPVVEQFSKDTYFVPNDTFLNTTNSRFMIITGPNMAGKSTYMRQVALICLMAQIGSFVPAKEARIGIVDKLFTRVGASDDLAMGQSTFMLEMSEVAYILTHATKKSLIIYDEIGRGTSTYDGMSIARAVAEYTNGKKIGAKTLFATHYHELTSLEDECPGVVNYYIAAKKKGDGIIFLRKIIPGSADDSYGIEVAKLAGVPKEVTKRANDILQTLESNKVVREKEAKDESGMISFDDFKENEVISKLKNIDINTLTPLEAINLIYELKKML